MFSDAIFNNLESSRWWFSSQSAFIMVSAKLSQTREINAFLWQNYFPIQTLDSMSVFPIKGFDIICPQS